MYNGWFILLGVLGRDFPVYATIPETSFNCSDKEVGFYADAETDCQVSTYEFV